MSRLKTHNFQRGVCVFLSVVLAVSPAFAKTKSNAGGGLLSSIIQQPVINDCGNNTASAQGKTTEIDGVELKLPVDWNYAHTQQSDFNGTNWQGDDSVRGIGIFNCQGEEGDKTPEYKNGYCLNMRWEGYTYSFKDNAWPNHKKYTGTDTKTGITVGGTSMGVAKIRETVDSNQQYAALSKAKFIVWNPESGKAVVCAAGGFGKQGGPSWVGKGEIHNWGGGPLALLGGLSEAASQAIDAKQNESILHVYFTDESAVVGTIIEDYQPEGGSSSSGGCEEGGKADSDVLEVAKAIAEDDSVGYNQSARLLSPDVDCSSFVCYCFLCAGYDVSVTNTDGMFNKDCGFNDDNFEFIDFDKSKLQPGDIVLRDKKPALHLQAHTELVSKVEGGEVYTYGAHQNRDGRPGDSSGTEVNEAKLNGGNESWDKILRLKSTAKKGTPISYKEMKGKYSR